MAQPSQSAGNQMVLVLSGALLALGIGTWWVSRPASAGRDRGRADIEIEADEPDEDEPADPLAAPPDVRRPPASAETTASGLASRVLRRGTGTEHPTATSTVRVHYTGWQTDGTRFDSSVERGEPAEFPLNGVIAGWTEGLQLMVVGERRRFWIPADLAYGDPPRRPGAPGGMLVFDVELLAIE
jgi:peptidylprolyl isomerase